MFVLNTLIETRPGEYAPSQTCEFVFTNRAAGIRYGEHLIGQSYPAVRIAEVRPDYMMYRDEGAAARTETFERYSVTSGTWVPAFELVDVMIAPENLT